MTKSKQYDALVQALVDAEEAKKLAVWAKGRVIAGQERTKVRMPALHRDQPRR